MTVYEDLQRRAELCRKAAWATSCEKMRAIWLDHAQRLELRALNLPLCKAAQKIEIKGGK